MRRWILLPVVSGFLSCACGADPGDAVGDERTAGSAIPGELPVPPAEYVDGNGRTWLRQGPAKFGPKVRDRVAPKAPSAPAARYELPDTFEKFAQQFRGVRVMAGYEYLPAEPPLEVARRLYHHLKYGDEDTGPQRSTPSRPAPVETQVRSYSLSPVAMNDASTDFPGRAVVWNEYGCSGTMISRGTMITAAHCVYETFNNHYIETEFWPGENLDHSVAKKPYGSVTFGLYGCATVVLPQPYKDLPDQVGDAQWDFAVVDFNSLYYVNGQWVSCEQAKGDQTGWLGWWIIQPSELTQFATYLKGYPSCLNDFDCTNGYKVYVDDMAPMYGQSTAPGGSYISSPSYVIRSNLLTFPGSSGSGLHVLEFDYPYLIGTLSESDSRFRRFDATVRDFVSTNSDYIDSTDYWGPTSHQVYDCASREPKTSTFCSVECPCVYAEGDCDEPIPEGCVPGLVCATDKGPGYGMGPTFDVCLPATCAARTLGTAGYCSSGCKCGHGGGDCNYDSHCLPGLHCGNNNGAAFGYAASVDVCVP